MQSKMAPLEKRVQVLKAEMEERKKRIASTFAITDLSLLREAGANPGSRIFCALTAERTFAGSDVGVREYCFRLLQEKILSPPFLDSSTFLQSILTMQKASAKTVLPKSVPTRTEAWTVFHRILYMKESMSDGGLHAKMQGKTGCRIGVAVQIMTRAWIALSKSIGLGSFQTGYAPYSLYERRTAALQVLKSRKNS